MRRQLHALGLAAGERRRRLAQPQISETHLFQHPQLLHDLRYAREEVQRFLHGQVSTS